MHAESRMSHANAYYRRHLPEFRLSAQGNAVQQQGSRLHPIHVTAPSVRACMLGLKQCAVQRRWRKLCRAWVLVCSAGL